MFRIICLKWSAVVTGLKQCQNATIAAKLMSLLNHVKNFMSHTVLFAASKSRRKHPNNQAS